MRATAIRSRARVLLSALALAAVVGLGAVALRDGDGTHPGPTDGAANRFPCPSWLSFVSTRSGRKQIYAIDVHRPEEVVQVTRSTGHAFDPTWSPDGARVAFRWFHPDDSSVGVYVADARGSDVELLADRGVTPAWSPDGRFIAHAGPEGLSIADVAEVLEGDPSASRALTRPPSTLPHEYPVWSPDGRRLLFSGYSTNGSYDIWVVDSDGRHLRDLTPRSSLDYGATWSPDGDRIVFGSSGVGLGEADKLFVMDDDGANVDRLTFGAGPTWSPDGRWIAFGSTRRGDPDVYIMRPDGTQQRRLTSHPGDDLSPAWIGDC